jgi:hypothetical protein
MKIAVAAFLFAKRDVNVDHKKKSSEKFQSSNVFNLNKISI